MFVSFPTNREKRGLQSTTLPNYLSNIKNYLGYLQKYHHIPEADLSLSQCANPTLFIDYIAFKKACGLEASSLSKLIAANQCVVDFLRANKPRQCR